MNYITNIEVIIFWLAVLSYHQVFQKESVTFRKKVS